jgi:hypothetical protein
MRLDPKNIPEPFHPLIPYAEKWGISDDGYLDEAIDEASLNELRDLVKTVSEFDAEGFDDWLSNRGTPDITREWVAFVSLINAHDLAKSRLQSMSPPNDGQ